MTSNNLAEGLFDKRDFVYDERKDEYRCPAGQTAIYRSTRIENGKTLHRGAAIKFACEVYLIRVQSKPAMKSSELPGASPPTRPCRCGMSAARSSEEHDIYASAPGCFR
jgi:hypothetical protein